jgi:hypothetical protein
MVRHHSDADLLLRRPGFSERGAGWVYGNGHHSGSGSTGGLTDRLGTPFGTWHHRFIDWFRDLGFLQPPGVETRAARDLADYAKGTTGRPGGGTQAPPGGKN